MDKQIFEIYDAGTIADRVKALAAEIAVAYEGRELTVLCVLEDSFVFLADLLRHLTLSPRTVFLRYDHQSLGGLQDISFSTQTDLARREVLLVEGVLDTGVTQEYLVKQLGALGASSVKLCVLLDKPDRRRVQLEPDYRAFETREPYVFGYGLGFQERYRELPYLATFARSNGDAG
jgi:hypoxanthine phosphoribosyltransferase